MAGPTPGKRQKPNHAGRIDWIADKRRGTRRCRGRVMIGGKLVTITLTPKPKQKDSTVEEIVQRELNRQKLLEYEGKRVDRSADRTVGDQADAWIEERRLSGVRASSLENYRNVVDVHVRPAWGDTMLSRLDRGALVRWLNAKMTDPQPFVDRRGRKRKARALSAERVELIRLVLTSILTLARDVEKRPVPDGILPLPAPAVRKKSKAFATPKQVLALFGYLRRSRDRLFALWVLSFFTGARLGELLGLRWASVDWERGVVVIAEKLPQRGDRDEPTWEPTKTGVEVEKPLPRFAMTVLRWHRMRQRVERVAAAAWADHDLVFPTAEGRPMMQKVARYHFARALKACAIPYFPPKQLRHTFATLMRVAGNDSSLISEIIGHRDLETTGAYMQPVSALQREAVRKLEALVLGSDD